MRRTGSGLVISAEPLMVLARPLSSVKATVAETAAATREPPDEALTVEVAVYVDLIRFGGHLPKGGYDVRNGRHTQPASPPAVHG